MSKTEARMTETELARLGGGVVGYVRQIENTEARSMLGENFRFPPHTKLFALFNADGSPVSISGSREAAMGDAIQHDLIPASVH